MQVDLDAEVLEKVKDRDLLARLEKTFGQMGYASVRRMAIEEQAERDLLNGLSPVRRRRAEVRKQLGTEKFSHEDRHHIHSVLALCGLPYREPKGKQREFIREYGKNSLVVQAGYLKDPLTGKMVAQGIPYGPKARLMLLHVCTQAVRQKSPEIEIADSMSAFMKDLGFSVTGGKRGTIVQFKEQLNRLAGARMQIGLWDGETATTLNAQPIKSFDVWLPTDPAQKLLWSSTLRLDQSFYESLREHALPVDMRALRAFSQSAKQIDIVLWLGYRVRKLTKPYLVTWETLQDQFGADVQSARRFRFGFREDLAAVKEVFPNMSVDLTEHGMMIRPCDPEHLFVPSKRTLLGPVG